jgi:uncharacterized protein DUF4242
MPKYLIEREVPEAGSLLPEQLRSMSEASRRVLDQMGPQIQWVNSFVTDDRIYCVYIARDQQLIREHARTCGIPVGRISEIKTLIDPATAE